MAASVSPDPLAATPMRSIIISYMVIVVIGCNSKAETENGIPLNDTGIALAALFNEEFLQRNMPGYGAPGIGQKSIFGDTVLLEFNDSLDKHIPRSFANHYLKRITRDSFCGLRKRMHNEAVDFPDFLRLISFHKNDSGFNIMLQATCVMPGFVNRKFDTTLPCIFGFLCGGGISVTAVKRGDSFYLRRDGGWSD